MTWRKCRILITLEFPLDLPHHQDSFLQKICLCLVVSLGEGEPNLKITYYAY